MLIIVEIGRRLKPFVKGNFIKANFNKKEAERVFL